MTTHFSSNLISLRQSSWYNCIGETVAAWYDGMIQMYSCTDTDDASGLKFYLQVNGCDDMIRKINNQENADMDGEAFDNAQFGCSFFHFFKRFRERC